MEMAECLRARWRGSIPRARSRIPAIVSAVASEVKQELCQGSPASEPADMPDLSPLHTTMSKRADDRGSFRQHHDELGDHALRGIIITGTSLEINRVFPYRQGA